MPARNRVVIDLLKRKNPTTDEYSLSTERVPASSNPEGQLQRLLQRAVASGTRKQGADLLRDGAAVFGKAHGHFPSGSGTLGRRWKEASQRSGRANPSHETLPPGTALHGSQGLGGSYRELSKMIAMSPLYRWFCHCEDFEQIQVPGKSALADYATWLPLEDLEEVHEQLRRAISDGDVEDFQRSINAQCMAMAASRRKPGGKKQTRSVLWSMKQICKTVLEYGKRYRELLDEQWGQSDPSCWMCPKFPLSGQGPVKSLLWFKSAFPY